MVARSVLHGRHRACVHALLLLECPTEAISEALLLNIHDAKQLVHQLHQLGSSIDILRELWMNIARVVVDQESDMAVPIALLQESGGILTIDVNSSTVYFINVLFFISHIFLLLLRIFFRISPTLLKWNSFKRRYA